MLTSVNTRSQKIIFNIINSTLILLCLLAVLFDAGCVRFWIMIINE